ncbi:hypothetical protein B0T09DRAFT_322737 [Sordaria sp. MPI-SDFR-AT-0083]|nr:hypothetical protein B0T09DRAFT_322737 [Sordaria sp. MPI-SDFR-AT-0083]
MAGNLARNRRDGILDKLHQDVSDVVRSRSTPPPTDHFASGRPDKKRRLKKYLPAEARNLLTEAPRSGDQRPSTQPEIPTLNEFPAGFTRAFGTFPRPHSPARGLCWEITDEDEKRQDRQEETKLT